MDFWSFAGTAIPLGIVATAIMDLIVWLQSRLLRGALPDYGLVGRWVIGLRDGRFRHTLITQSPAQRFEQPVGWAVHYGVGIAYVVIMLLATGPEWAARPTILPPLLTGLLSLAVPFLIMQPAFGYGIAASKTSNPLAARARSVMGHLIYGVSIYLAGMVLVCVPR